MNFVQEQLNSYNYESLTKCYQTLLHSITSINKTEIRGKLTSSKTFF